MSMTMITIKDVIGKKPVKQDLSTRKLSRLDGKLSKKVGVDELLACLNPATFDFGCIIKNVDWLINSTLNNVYLSCSLGEAKPDPGFPARQVSSGACLSWFGLPALGQPQKCQNFDSANKAFQLCQSKCNSLGKTHEQSGCDGSTLYCWCT